MARPLSELLEKLSLIGRIIGDVKLMGKESETYKNVQSADFAKVCFDLTTEAVYNFGSYDKALDLLILSKEGKDAAAGFLRALGSLAGSSHHSGENEALGHVYTLLRESNQKILSYLKEGFSAQERHFDSKPNEEVWTSKTAGYLCLAEPVILLDYGHEAIQRNMHVAIDVLRVLESKQDATSNWEDFKDCFKQVIGPIAANFGSRGIIGTDDVVRIASDQDGYYVQKSSEEIVHQIIEHDITGAQCVNRVDQIATMLANPAVFDGDKFKDDLYAISVNADYMHTSFLMDFTTSYRDEKKKLGMVAPSDVFLDLSSQKIQDFKSGLYLFQNKITGALANPKILLASMAMDISAGECLDIKKSRHDHPLWLEKTLATNIGDLKSIEKAEDPASVYLTVLLKNALGLEFDQRLPLKDVEMALYSQDKRKKEDFSAYPFP